jgi:galactokinase
MRAETSPILGRGFDRAAVDTLDQAFGAGASPATAVAPGRVTVIGEHVDYAGGRVVCMAIDLVLAVSVRPSADAKWRVASGVTRVERSEPAMQGDVGDRVFACALSLRRRGIDVPPLEIGVAGDLPVAAGLSSSAAVMTASLVAMLRLCAEQLTADSLVAAAVTAERDIVGVPNGDMDQRAVVHSRAESVLVLDCSTGTRRFAPWPWPEIGLLVATSGERHDNLGAGYRARRTAVERALTLLGVRSCQEIGDRWGELPAELQPMARHIATETRRSDAAAEALRRGDCEALGHLIDASHESLRRDFEISTPRIDAMVEAARQVQGCYGVRLVGGGFGGSVIALVDHASADRCAAAMSAVSGIERGTWLVDSSPGLEVTATDVVVPDRG